MKSKSETKPEQQTIKYKDFYIVEIGAECFNVYDHPDIAKGRPIGEEIRNLDDAKKAIDEWCIEAARLSELKQIINTEHKGARKYDKECHKLEKFGKRVLAHVWKIGPALMEVKNILPHGWYEQWVKDNCDFSMSTAEIYVW